MVERFTARMHVAAFNLDAHLTCLGDWPVVVLCIVRGVRWCRYVGYVWPFVCVMLRFVLFCVAAYPLYGSPLCFVVYFCFLAGEVQRTRLRRFALKTFGLADGWFALLLWRMLRTPLSAVRRVPQVTTADAITLRRNHFTIHVNENRTAAWH